MSLSFLKREERPALAYKLDLNAKGADTPLIVFLSGFRSDMEGTKAAFLAKMCHESGYDFLRFDYSGHGRSEGSFEDGTIGGWAEDALAMIDMTMEQAGAKPLVLIGSSMGGWIGLLCALKRPDRVKAYIGLAAAPDFTRSIEKDMSSAQKEQLRKDGYFLAPDGQDGFFKVTDAFLKDGETHCLLDAPIELKCPAWILHGQMDRDVPVETARTLYKQLSCDRKKIHVLPESGHRLSSAEDLMFLQEIVLETIEI